MYGFGIRPSLRAFSYCRKQYDQVENETNDFTATQRSEQRWITDNAKVISQAYFGGAGAGEKITNDVDLAPRINEISYGV